ncbi:MAG TPA: DUF2911 domain-containing protein, partial [Chitinophagaceae bacterium]|nr:DUF2911 domain-containing protein [Chitinophagaceae bacterium]
MRPFLPLITLIFLVACTSETEHHDGKPRLQIKDTSLVAADSQANPYAPVDVSPMDMSYYPVDYPMAKMANPDTLPPLARVIYSRPHLQGRQLFHGLLSYGVPWRLGANEATELDLFSEAM